MLKRASLGALALAALVLIGAQTLESTSAETTLPESRTGGIYDRLVVLRLGIDDLGRGMSFGQFVSCIEQTVEEGLARKSLPKERSEVKIVSDEYEATLRVRGVDGRYVRFHFLIFPRQVVLYGIETPTTYTEQHDMKMYLMSTFLDLCHR